METATIKKTFLDFYTERGHTIVPSSSLVPDDPSLLFTGAGMIQFKPYFLGLKDPPYKRAASVQKIVRAGGKDNDLEEVGKTSRHFTFFEMLGNFSFGDYFKSEAIGWAWELVTKSFGMDAERLYITVYSTDDEAAEIWEKEVGVQKDRIIRRGKDNYWSMGVAGPAGPCSEILYDRGESFGKPYVHGEDLDDERYLEFYNLVFMQDLQNEDGEIVGELPSKNIDTGLGLARLAMLLQAVPTIFDIDSVRPLVDTSASILGTSYGKDPEVDVSIRVMAEHSRALAMLIADGVLPSNESRGYVLRRLIRRAIRYAKKAGFDEPFLTRLTDVVVDLYSDAYPELRRNAELIRRVVQKEESRFSETLRQGLGMLEEEIAKVNRSDTDRLSGDVAFRLHDTYGFPFDLTSDIASDEGIEVDHAEFKTLMGEQKVRARAARETGVIDGPVSEVLSMVLDEKGRTDFVGYESLSKESSVVALARDSKAVASLEVGDVGEVILDSTPFYAEGGGQIGDRGHIRTPNGEFEVEETKWGVPGVIVHKGKVTVGSIVVDDDATAAVDRVHREDVTQSHTATHIVHWGLRSTLGEHARQQGSLVEPGRLRFDFSHFEPVGSEQLAELEEEVNRRVLKDDTVRAFETTYEYAMSLGAMALFGEKYGDFVRVVEVGDYSRELCGGTHVVHTGKIGIVKFVHEGSVAAGTRRVEAYTGMTGYRHLTSQAAQLQKAAELLKVEPDRLLERLEKTLEHSRSLEVQIAKQRAVGQKAEIESILGSGTVRKAGSASLLAIRRDTPEVDELRKLAASLRDRIGSGIVIIASASNGKANLVAATSRDLVSKGVSSGSIVEEGAKVLGGGGGGKPDLAVAGGPHSQEIDKALSVSSDAATRILEGLS